MVMVMVMAMAMAMVVFLLFDNKRSQWVKWKKITEICPCHRNRCLDHPSNFVSSFILQARKNNMFKCQGRY